MHIGNTIKVLRKDRGWTQDDFAERINISVTSLSLIESGKTRPNKTTLCNISRVLNIPEHFLYVLSISEEDVSDDKKAIYNALAPTLKHIINELVK